MTTDLNSYLNLFKVSRNDLDTLIAEALRSGGDYADLYFENTTFNNLVLKDSQVGDGGFHSDYGVGIRVLSGDKTGYAYSESTARQDMLLAARAAASISNGKSSIFPLCVKKEAAHTTDYPAILEKWENVDVAAWVPLLVKLEQQIKASDTRIVKVVERLAWSTSEVLMYNSHGQYCTDSRPLYSLVASVIYQSNGDIVQKTASRSFRLGPETIDDALLCEIVRDATSGIDALFEAERPKGGQMPVVMAAGASGILLHEAMGHAFEADFNRKGQSVFSGRIGERICAQGIDIVDDGTLPGNRGSSLFDDEGISTEKTYMVRDGILESYLHDRISAKHFGVSPTGNGRRESFRFNPIPRMRATYMGNARPGSSVYAASAEDIISTVKKGIYVDEFSNGQVKIGEGDFTFYVKSGYLIEKGRLTRPVKDINVIGNGPRALADITMAAPDLKVDNGTWTCGKEQSVPVSCGIPTVLVSSLTVGGR